MTAVLPKLGLSRPPKIKIRRSLVKAVSWRLLGTVDTLILSFVLMTVIGPIFGFNPEKGEALETAGLIAITEVITKMVLYFVHERLWAKLKWGTASQDGDRSVSYRRSVAKTTSWRTLASTDTILIAWFYTGNLATALSIGGLEVFTKLILYFLHERLWAKISFGIHYSAPFGMDPVLPKAESAAACGSHTATEATGLSRRALARWANEGGTIPAPSQHL